MAFIMKRTTEQRLADLERHVAQLQRGLLIVADKTNSHGVGDEIRAATGLSIHGEEKGEPEPPDIEGELGP